MTLQSGQQAQSGALPTRYHPALVALHWLVAGLILALLAMGFLKLANMSNADPGKIAILRAHMAGGITVLALMIVRFVVRHRTARPAPILGGGRLRTGATAAVHSGFYLLVPLVAVTGLVTARLAGLPAIVFGGSGAPLPASFDIYPSFAAHALLATLLAATIAVHAAAACYHRFIERQPIFGRMWFGRRGPGAR